MLKKLRIISEDLFHDSPKIKPPRFDLRKRKKMDDPDFEEIDEEEYDEDLDESE